MNKLSRLVDCDAAFASPWRAFGMQAELATFDCLAVGNIINFLINCIEGKPLALVINKVI